MQICSKCSTSSPDLVTQCPKCGSDLREWSTIAVALKKFQNNPRVSHVRVSVGGDCCPACRAIEGVYEKHAVPALPLDGCSHEHGCRCHYAPVLDELFP